KKILIVAPTKPLVHQHLRSFKELIEDPNDNDFAVFTGAIKPAKRQELFAQSKVIFSTPQGLENDILSSRIHLKDIGLLVFDEAHRATGDYSYVWLAKQFIKQSPQGLILGLTASPGTDTETIQEVVDNLHITQIEYREQTDPDVKPYIKKTRVLYDEVDLPSSITDLHKALFSCYESRVAQLQSFGYFQQKTAKTILKKELLLLTGSLQQQIAQQNFEPEVLQGISLSAQILKLSYALELCETQGIPSTFEYLHSLVKDAQAKKSKGVVALYQDPKFRFAYTKARELFDQGVTHPKLSRLQDIVLEKLAEKPDAKIIIFSQYRETLSSIVQTLQVHKQIRASLFFLKKKKKGVGMSQKEQLQTIQDFTDGIHNVLCMSSVGEEGLDIPSVDIVVFYEPIPSAIRTIQRRGRTGRQDEGLVRVLCAKNTRDMSIRWIAQKKEQKMYGVLEAFQKKQGTKKVTLDSFASAKSEMTPTYTLFADSREKKSGVLRLLHDKDIDIKSQRLTVGDFQLSDDVIVEFKHVGDFVDSLLDKRLFEQVKKLKETVRKPIILIQGEESIYGVRNIHPNAINGMLATITVSFQIPVLFTRTDAETANLLYTILKREQDARSTPFVPQHMQKVHTKKEQLQEVVSHIPSVGPLLAQKLLEKFHTLESLSQASVKDLSNIDGIGPQKARNIHSFFRIDYTDSNNFLE
ncbi:MAG: ERCC4 domain-containing protein, partial [Candidatus Woesearchaeota archaeon]